MVSESRTSLYEACIAVFEVEMPAASLTEVLTAAALCAPYEEFGHVQMRVTSEPRTAIA
jgi:hypothetical protein